MTIVMVVPPGSVVAATRGTRSAAFAASPAVISAANAPASARRIRGVAATVAPLSLGTPLAVAEELQIGLPSVLLSLSPLSSPSPPDVETFSPAGHAAVATALVAAASLTGVAVDVVGTARDGME